MLTSDLTVLIAILGCGGLIVVLLWNLSLRRRLERVNPDLAAAEAQLRTALEHMSGRFFIVDQDLNYLVVNDRYRELYELPEALVRKGKSMIEVLRFRAERGDYGPGDPEKLLQERIEGYRSGQVERTVDTVPGGRVIETLRAPSGDGGVISVSSDITEQKRAEEDLAKKEAQLRIALDSVPGGIRYVDRDRNYVFFNAQYSKLYDFPDGLLKVGDSTRVENLYQAERGDLGSGKPEELTDAWLAELPVDTERTSWERATVHGRILQVRTSPAPTGGYVSIVTDITERKKIEAEIAEKTRVLEATMLSAELPTN